jgi:hypothetical protein
MLCHHDTGNLVTRNEGEEFGPQASFPGQFVAAVNIFWIVGKLRVPPESMDREGPTVPGRRSVWARTVPRVLVMYDCAPGLDIEALYLNIVVREACGIGSFSQGPVLLPSSVERPSVSSSHGSMPPFMGALGVPHHSCRVRVLKDADWHGIDPVPSFHTLVDPMKKQ